LHQLAFFLNASFRQYKGHSKAEKRPFDPLEYVEHLDQLPFDPNMDPDLGK
jgi:hypothetical protein